VTPIVSLITDRRHDRVGGAEGLIARVAWAARAGVHLVQVRERDLDGGALTVLVGACLDAVRGSAARVIVNDRLDVALAAGAHGVHLRGDSMAASRVRTIAPRGFLIGRSVHGLDEARRAEMDGGLDYLQFGTVFPTASKPGLDAAGVPALAAVARAVRLPVLAVGGVAPDNLTEVAAAGAAGFAAIGLFATLSEAALADAVARATAAFAADRIP
jgi:thiamine-phosphate pyrophosphorylase